MHRPSLSLLLGLLAASAWAAESESAQVTYRLPTDGPLPRTWRVTLAITDPKHPEWIISQFAAGVPRTVTAENGGRFSETWDGLDDNFMPVPAGDYTVKGICMPAARWEVDGEMHSITPTFVGGVSDWLPPVEQAGKRGEPFTGDPVNSPIGDVAVSPQGIAVFYYSYLENGQNNPMIDLRKAQGPDQFMRAFPSGGCGGGASTCTDGESVWSFSQDGGSLVYRADSKAFGASPRGSRRNSYQPDGYVTAMAAIRGETASTVFVAERGRLVPQGKNSWVEGPEPLDVVTVHAGADGKLLATLPLARPRGLAARGDYLYGLHAVAGGSAVSKMHLRNGLPEGAWQQVLALPAGVEPGGLTVDSQGRIYVSDPAANHVYQFAADGKRLRSYGRLAVQRPGSFDRETLMRPTKLAAWTDEQGRDRLLIMDSEGPCRVSEWGADGALIREFPSLQTRANDGWAVDPADPRYAYLLGFGNWLSRYVIDYSTGHFTLDAVWPEVGNDPLLPSFDHVRMVHYQGQPFLVCSPRKQYAIYRLDGARWKLAAGIINIAQAKGPAQTFAWRDGNGDGTVQEEEFRSTPITIPGWALRYHGNQVGSDMSLLAINQNGRDIWRLPIARLDARGVPEFGALESILTDPVFAARNAGTSTALFGGNELSDTFNSDWAQCDGTPETGYWVTARGGPNINANFGGQQKVSAYVPDGTGGMRLRWRVGRVAINNVPKAGETISAIHIRAPINNILPVIDQSRCGVLLYNQDGLYVDTMFPPGGSRLGIYDLPGEFFAGMVYPDPQSGAIYVGVGKDTPLVFRCENWSLQKNPVRALPELQERVSITLAQIARPPEVALALRGGAGAARLARFSPAFGGVEHDGSLAGWEQCDPVVFRADKDRHVEVRCLYDPDHLYLRVHARTGSAFTPHPLQPLERVFAHERASDAVSFYLQGDPAAKSGGPSGGRAHDVRIVLGLFNDADKVRPAAIGFYPSWTGSGASPQAYQTPVGRAEFAHVGELAGSVLGGNVDADGKGWVVSVSIPRSAIPGLPSLTANLRTTANFEATFGGHAKFWWANVDGSASSETFDEPTEARLYPGSWAPVEFAAPGQSGVIVRNWLVCGPFGGPGVEKFVLEPQGKMKDEVRDFYHRASFPPDRGPFDATATFSGSDISGWWPAEKIVRWQPATIPDLDARVVLGKGAAQLWYVDTWIRASSETAVTLQVQSKPQTRVRTILNEVVVANDDAKVPSTTGVHAWLTSDVPVVLKPGWNHLRLRTYSWGYGSVKAGVAIIAPLDRLWGLRCSGQPPARMP